MWLGHSWLGHSCAWDPRFHAEAPFALPAGEQTEGHPEHSVTAMGGSDDRDAIDRHDADGVAAASPPEETVVAGRYELAEALGSGRSSTVFRARDRRTGFPVAVKIVSTSEGRVADAKRVEEEAAHLAKIGSRHVVSAHDHGLDTLGAYLVTDLVEGSWLGPELLGRPFFPHEVLRAARGLLSGLAAAHAAGVVHHDLRPANVIVPGDRLESAVLVDFGVANAIASDSDDDATAWGTLRYGAPERLSGHRGDSRSDVFSAGMLLYELLGLPLEREPADSDLAVPLALVPKPLSTLLERMIANDPGRRFATASDALAVVLDLDTAPIEQGVDPRGPPSVRASARVVATKSPTRLFRLAEDPVVALRECLSALDFVLLDALARREKGGFAAVASHAFGLSLRSALASVDETPLSRALASAVVLPRASRALAALHDESLGSQAAALDAIEPELHAVLATFAAILATPKSVRTALLSVRRAATRLREDALAPRTVLGTLMVAEVALAVVCEDRLARSAIAEARAIMAKEGPAVALHPLDRLARGLLLGATALHEDPELARAELEAAGKLATEAKSALVEARVLSELGRLLVLDSATREQGLGWLVRVETLVAHAEAPTFEHASHHDRGGASLLRGRYDEAAVAYGKARAVLVDEGQTDGEVLSGASLALTKLASGDAGSADFATSLVADFVEPRLAVTEARTAAFALLARAMVALTAGDLARARRDVERARGFAVEVVRGSQDAVGLVEIADALLCARGLPAESGASSSENEGRTRDLAEVVRVHSGGALRFLPILRAIVSRVPNPALRLPLLAAADAALRDVVSPPSGDRITLPPPSLRDPTRV